MTYDPLLISLPVADRVRANAFYRDGLGLDAIGEPADDGVPESASPVGPDHGVKHRHRPSSGRLFRGYATRVSPGQSVDQG